jgi:hypothetical protein
MVDPLIARKLTPTSTTPLTNELDIPLYFHWVKPDELSSKRITQYMISELQHYAYDWRKKHFESVLHLVCFGHQMADVLASRDDAVFFSMEFCGKFKYAREVMVGMLRMGTCFGDKRYSFNYCRIVYQLIAIFNELVTYGDPDHDNGATVEYLTRSVVIERYTGELPDPNVEKVAMVPSSINPVIEPVDVKDADGVPAEQPVEKDIPAIPLPICKMMRADFDGDEVEAYQSATYVEAVVPPTIPDRPIDTSGLKTNYVIHSVDPARTFPEMRMADFGGDEGDEEVNGPKPKHDDVE